MDAGGVMCVVAAEDRRGNVGAGEIHVRRAVLWRVQPRNARGIHAEVGRVMVEERKRAGQLGLLVDHLEKNNMKSRHVLPSGVRHNKRNKNNKFTTKLCLPQKLTFCT